MESVWSLSKLSTKSVGSRRELFISCELCSHHRRDATRQFLRVGVGVDVGGVYWVLGRTCPVSICRPYAYVQQRYAADPGLSVVRGTPSAGVSRPMWFITPSFGFDLWCTVPLRDHNISDFKLHARMFRALINHAYIRLLFHFWPPLGLAY